MSYCEKCGAYIPMDDTACPACGYDPEKERAEQRRQEEARREQEKRESREKYQYAGAQQQEYAYGQGTGQQYSAYEQSRQERKTTGTGTANKDWQWNGGQRPLWEDPNKTNANYEDYAQKAKEWAERSVDGRFFSILSYIGPLFLVPLLMQKGDPFARHHANQGLTLFLFNALLTLVETFVPFGGLIQGVGGLFALFCMVKGVISVVNGRLDKLPLLGDIRLIK